MRRIILLLFAIALVGGGLAIVWSELVVAPTVYWSGLAVGMTLAALGAYLLWDDFIQKLLAGPSRSG